MLLLFIFRIFRQEFIYLLPQKFTLHHVFLFKVETQFQKKYLQFIRNNQGRLKPRGGMGTLRLGSFKRIKKLFLFTVGKSRKFCKFLSFTIYRVSIFCLAEGDIYYRDYIIHEQAYECTAVEILATHDFFYPW